MHALTNESISLPADPREMLSPTATATAQSEFEASSGEVLQPNALVRWAFYFSVFAIPFQHLYLPGTGDRIGVVRLVQVLIAGAVLSQPRVCLRFVPAALFWFLAYCVMRIVWGLWLSPEMSRFWWPVCVEFLELLLPWFWVMFNVLQFPNMRRGGLWALGLGCTMCALFHIAGIGVSEVHSSVERSSVFGMNANQLGAAYGTAATALLGLWMLRPRTPVQRWLPFPLIAIIGVAMAKTGSRSAILLFVLGVLVLIFFGRTFGSRIRRVAGLVLLGAVLTLILWTIPTVMERFDQLNPQNIGEHNPRARMVPVLWEIFLRSPVYGTGPDSYEFELTRRAMPYLIREQKTIVAHNLILLLLVETGVIGFLLFSAGLGTALMAAWRARLTACGSLPLALIVPIIIGGATVSNPAYDLVFWVALAYALAGAA